MSGVDPERVLLPPLLAVVPSHVEPLGQAVAPSHVKPVGQAVHTLLSTYLVAAHLVAVVPSHVEPLGQAVHSLSRT